MIGTALGPYKIFEQIGVGGMGEVYVGEDTRLGRRVAIKVLPGELVADADRVARFRREAEILAALNSQHIAQIYGLEQDGELMGLVLELVEGPTLAERLDAGPLALEEALRIALQLAEGLEVAHERGIIHRDLKPANIKVRSGEGGAPIVKILDFGLGKAHEETAAEDGSRNAADSPTLSLAATQAGLILGTAGYMSPEQAKGHPADRRADIWSFGAVVFEMLAGEKLFDADTVSEVLAAVLMKDPEWEALPADTPAPIRQLLRRCLMRDPRSRLRDIGEARICIEQVLAGNAVESTMVGGDVQAAAAAARDAAGPGAAGRSGFRDAVRHPAVAWGVALIAVVAAVAFVLVDSLPTAPSRPGGATTRFGFSAPPGVRLELATEVSSDGRTVAFAGRSQGESIVWLRPLDSLQPRPLPGTEGATEFFWSPESDHLAFFARGRLRTIELSSGSVTDLAAAPRALGGSWSRDGVIIYAAGGPIRSIPASGGSPVEVTRLDPERGEDAHMWPRFLPDGKHFLFLADELADIHPGVWVSTIDSAERTMVLEGAVHASYVPPGFLLFPGAVGGGGWRLVAQPFDPDRLELSGERTLVAPLPAVGRPHRFAFSAAANGTIVYQAAAAEETPQGLSWFDVAGTPDTVIGALEVAPRWFDLSYDDERVLITADGEIWILELEGLTSRRLTLPETSRYDSALWSPTADRIAYLAMGERNEVRVRDLATGTEQSIAGGAGQEFFLHDWSADGQWIMADGGDGVYALAVSGDRPPRRVVAYDGDIFSPALSPGDEVVAYGTDEGVYVVPFDEQDGDAARVSFIPGREPAWSPDGETLYFLDFEGSLTAVDVDLGATFGAGTPRRMFELPPTLRGSDYEISADGSRFLFAVPSGEPPAQSIQVIMNWAGPER